MLSASEVLSAILEQPTDLAHVRSLVTDDVTYISLNYDNPNLSSIMPWCGTHEHAGPESSRPSSTSAATGTSSTSNPRRYSAPANMRAIFGRFTYRSRVMSKLVTTPFAVFAKVKDERCYYLQFMEDTLATSASFRSGGQWTFRSNQEGGEVAF
jgi:hypothetical protein